MRSMNLFEWVPAAIGPIGLMCASVFARLPEWISGSFSSAEKVEPADETTAETFTHVEAAPAEPARTPRPLRAKPASGGPVQLLVDEMLDQGRYALLLRPQLVGNLSIEQLARTRAAFSEGMCLVPEGEVVLHYAEAGSEAANQSHALASEVLRVEAFYLDRYPVTNLQYHEFIAAGGYEQMAIWDREIWPAVLDFVDRGGHPGPRFWRGGGLPRGEENHPVVGVSWYEAAAFARWAGKRLVTDAEWVKAASWPVAFAGHATMQRRYPWGETMDRSRANLWGSGPGRTVAVEEFPAGVSVGGVQQLIGNVWEWTADAFMFDAAEPAGSSETMNLKSLRGGAFDTYLDNQATCHFQSGDLAMARKHNIGFRLAISLCDMTNQDGCHVSGLSEQTDEFHAEEQS
jgi:gamma-glutamyl hercynylcysteine S-oxide synthase